jgi:hypothetical protein
MCGLLSFIIMKRIAVIICFLIVCAVVIIAAIKAGANHSGCRECDIACKNITLVKK